VAEIEARAGKGETGLGGAEIPAKVVGVLSMGGGADGVKGFLARKWAGRAERVKPQMNADLSGVALAKADGRGQKGPEDDRDG